MITIIQLLVTVVPLFVYSTLYFVVMWYLLLQIDRLREEKKAVDLKKNTQQYIEKLKEIRSWVKKNDPMAIDMLNELIEEMEKE